jgi:hypothetical protein
MSDQRTNAAQLIALRVLKDVLGERDTAARAEMQAGMVVGDRTTAVVYGPDGGEIPVGYVLLGKGSSTTTASVTDAKALLAWVEEHAPSEVETTVMVRPAFQKRLLDAVKADGGWVLPESGELLDVPGVTVNEATPRPTLTVKPAENAEAVIREAWSDGRLSLAELTALPAGTS